MARELYDDWMSGKLDAARSLATPDVRLKLSTKLPGDLPGILPPTSCAQAALMKGWFGTGLVIHEGDLACGSRAIPSGYSIELYMTRVGDGNYRVSVVAFLYCEQRTDSPNQFVCTTDSA